MEEILDSFTELNHKGKRVIRLVIIASLLTAGIYFALFYLREINLKNLFLSEKAAIRLSGLLILIVTGVVPNRIAVLTDKIDHSKHSLIVGLLGGFTIFNAIILYKIALNFLVLGNEINSDLFEIITRSFVMSIIGFSFAFNKICRIRNENKLISALLLIGFCIGIGILINHKVI